MLGNGFDVSLGIKSSYKNFYEWYCPQDSIEPHIDNFRKNIDADINSNKPDEEKMWADFEVGIGKYTEHFSKDFVNYFLDCFIDAQEKIREYLLKQTRNFNVDEFSDNALKNFADSLSNFYDEITDTEKIALNNVLKSFQDQNRRISFVTFNYTNTLERILSRIPDSPLSSWRYGSTSFSYLLNRNVIHVHGTTEVAPILGVDNKSQISNKDLIDTPQFKEFLIKAESVNALGYLWQSQAETQISNSKIVCVLGMSLGATDAKWWRKLCQWLKNDSNRRLILYWFEKNPPSKTAYIRELQCKNKAKDLLLSYSSFSDPEKEILKNQIYVVINTNKFMQLKKEAEEENELEPTA